MKRGRTVTVVESSDTIGTGVLDFRLGLLLDWFDEEGRRPRHRGADMAIDRDRGELHRRRRRSGTRLPADTVVPTSPLTANTALFESLEGSVPELYAVGDCREPG